MIIIVPKLKKNAVLQKCCGKDCVINSTLQTHIPQCLLYSQFVQLTSNTYRIFSLSTQYYYCCRNMSAKQKLYNILKPSCCADNIILCFVAQYIKYLKCSLVNEHLKKIFSSYELLNDKGYVTLHIFSACKLGTLKHFHPKSIFFSGYQQN